jgi:uncharacterized protein
VRISLALALVLVSGTALAAGATPPAPERWVTDQVGMLSPGTRQTLDRRLEAYEARTGRQVIVWIGDTIGEDSLEAWAERTFRAWGIGRRGKDDGVALFVLARDRRMRIEVGYGLEGVLPDAVAARILREEMAPRLRQGDAGAAVTAAVNAILKAAGGEDPAAVPALEEPRPVRSVSKGELIVAGVGFLLFLVLLVTNPGLASALLFTMSARGHGGGWGGSSSRGWSGGGGGGFSGGGGRSGGGGASGSW